MSIALLLWGVLFSAIGLGYFLYGKKQTALVPLACGMLLMVVPFFIYNSYALVAVCSVLVALPYYWRA